MFSKYYVLTHNYNFIDKIFNYMDHKDVIYLF